ncbi:hypothetical protein ACQ5TV_04980, partial [Acetobacter ghanensis]|uniref:hypothetical protein n=1 Tax=Acetobacter ghanensis TaxID=431306 RepID=UPI003D32D443
SIRGSQIAHVSSVKVPVLSPSSIPTIWEEIQDLTGPSLPQNDQNRCAYTFTPVLTVHDVSDS